MKEKFNETNYIGVKYNMLKIIQFTRKKYVKGHRQFARLCLAECECGSIREYHLGNLKNGRSKSCGCKPFDVLGYSKHPLYGTYGGMIERCYNPKHENYKYYGGRGIKICDKWLNDFMELVKDMGEKPSPDHSIDRIDVNGNYEPSNCRWATQKEQMNNRRKSTLLTASNLARATGYSKERIRQLTGLSKFKNSNNELQKYIKSVTKTDYGYNSVVYKKEAITYLLDRKGKISIW